MARRLVRFQQAIFVTTLSFDDPETGKVKVHKFHCKGAARTLERIEEESRKEGVVPSNNVDDILKWNNSDVQDGADTYFGEIVSFFEQYVGYSIKIDRVLQIEESGVHTTYQVGYQTPSGSTHTVKFNDDELDTQFIGEATVNLSGGNQWVVFLRVPYRRLRVTLKALDALVSYNPGVSPKWSLTGDLGTLA